MSRSRNASAQTDDLPPAMTALWRTFRLAYRAEKRLLALSLGLALLMMLPDALLALWLKFLVDGVLDGDNRSVTIAGIGLAGSVTATWYLSLLSQRVQRRFRDRIAIALESHVAHLQASVPTIEHHERPEYLDRLSMLRDQVFALDHMFLSLFSTLGWLFRLAITAILLGSIHPVLVLLMVFALPAFWVSTWRPAVERKAEESVIANTRLARHLFVLGTTAAPAKEVRVTNTGEWLITEADAAWKRWYGPTSKSAMGDGRVARRCLGVVRRCLRGGGGVRRDRSRPDRGRRGPRTGSRHTPGPLCRCDGWRTGVPTRFLARLVAPARVARGLCSRHRCKRHRQRARRG